jgi:lysophospholipase L1-like esterase
MWANAVRFLSAIVVSVALLCGAMVGTPARAAGRVAYSTDFVTSSSGHTFTGGSLNGQDGWRDPANKATVGATGLSLANSTWNNPGTWVLRPESVLDQHASYTFAAGAVPQEFFAVGRYRTSGGGFSTWYVFTSNTGVLRAGKFVNSDVTWNPNNNSPLTSTFSPAYDASHSYRLDASFLSVAGNANATRILATVTDLTTNAAVATYDQTVTESALASAGQAGWYVATGSSRLTGFTYQDASPTTTDWEKNVPAADSNLFWSPDNWSTSTDGTVKQTAAGGAYVKVAFTGSRLGLAVERGGAPDDLSVSAYVDGAAAPTAQVTVADLPTTGEGVLRLASGLDPDATHTATVFLTTNSEASDRWNGAPANALRVTGLALDAGAKTRPLDGTRLEPKHGQILFFGDSITQWGGEQRWTGRLADDLGFEYGNIGYSGQGWSKTAPGGVPFFYPDGGADSAGEATWRWHSENRSRLTSSGRFQDGDPAAVFLNMGTNDATNNTNVAGVKDKARNWVTDIFAAAPDTAVYVVVPFCAGTSSAVARCDTVRGQLVAARDEYLATNPAAKLYLIDLGQNGYDWTHSPYGDGIHPNDQGNALIAQRIKDLLTPPAPKVAAQNDDGESLRLTWTATSPYVTGYEVSYRSAGASAWTAMPARAPGQESVVVSGLQPDTNYDFRVVATTPLTRSPIGKASRTSTEESLCDPDESGTVAAGCPRLAFSPYTWYTRSDGARQAVTSGSYVRFAFTGTSLGLSLLPDSVPSNDVQVDVIVDGADPITKRVNSASATTGALAFASGLAGGTHQAEVYISQTPNPGKYTGERNFPASLTGQPRGSLVVSGVTLASGGKVLPLDQLARPVSGKRIMIFGDSITESAHYTGTYHAQNSYAGHLGRLLGAEYGQLGYSGYAYLAKGYHPPRPDPDAAAFEDVWPNYFYGQPRLNGDGKWIDGSPDAIFLALGHNDLDYCATTSDMGLLAATVADTLDGMRKASGSKTELFLVPPFKTGAPAGVGSSGGSSCPLPVSWPEFKARVFDAGLDLYQARHRNAHNGADDHRTQLLGLGEIGYRVVQNWPDSDRSVHPGPESSRVLAGYLKEALTARAPASVLADRSDGKVLVRWEPAAPVGVASSDADVNGLPLTHVATGYRVEYQVSGTDEWLPGATAGAQDRAVQLTGVDAARVTKVRVVAFDELTGTDEATSATVTGPSDVAAVSGVSVTGPDAITVKGQPGAFSAEVRPDTAVTKSVRWWVTSTSGKATDKASISAQGVLTPLKNGQVLVKASATDGSGAVGQKQVSISGQTLPYISVGKPVVVSDTIDLPKERINDGDTATRWNANGSSNGGHPWVYVDLKAPVDINLITVDWEAAYAKDFRVQYSNDASNWTDIQVFTGQSLGTHQISRVDSAALEAIPAARYVRLYTDSMNNSTWGISIWEFSIDGTYHVTQPVTAITVAGKDGATTITQPRRSLQMIATATPADATDARVEWYVHGEDGEDTELAEMTATGLLLPRANGRVLVVAKAVDGGEVVGSCWVTITGQAKVNLALNKPVAASQSGGAGAPNRANDGSYATRWESGSMGADDRAWLEVDLGATKLIDQVTIAWETAAAPSFDLQVRTSSSANWKTVTSARGLASSFQDLVFDPVEARQLRLANMPRSAYGGVSAWEFEVYEALVDRSGLQALVSEAEGLAEPEYTTSSWAGLQDARDAANSVLTDREAAQEDVDAARDALSDAMAQLVRRGDPSMLDVLVPLGTALSERRDGFTDESVDALRVALDAAIALDRADASQAEIDASAAALRQAVDGLVVRPAPAVDKSVLVEAYGAAQAVSNADGRYSAASWSRLQAEVVGARAVLDDGAATQAEVGRAVSGLASAVSGLELVPVVPSVAVLRAVYEGARAVSNAGGRYTSASWSRLQGAIADAGRALESGSASQAVIDRAVVALSAAVAGLVPAGPVGPSSVPVVSRVKLNQSQLRLVKGKTFRLEEGVYFTNVHPAYAGAVVWRSSDTRVASVSGAGLVKAKKAGVVRITATAVHGNSAGVRLSAAITVSVVKSRGGAKVTKVVAVVPRSMAVGQSVYITGTYSSSKAAGVKVSYGSSKAAVAVVDPVGRILARGKGSVKITVKAGGKSKTYKITVR